MKCSETCFIINNEHIVMTFFCVCCCQVPVFRPMDLMVEASPRRIFANAHTYHINSISINSDYETYLSADDLRINLWHLEITDRSFSIHLVSLFWCLVKKACCAHTRFLFVSPQCILIPFFYNGFFFYAIFFVCVSDETPGEVFVDKGHNVLI